MTQEPKPQDDLHEAWNALSAPDREPPREDMAAAATAVCQTIEAAIAVAQGLAVHLCGPDPAKEGSHARPH
jgi:hypothetical protein